jgi:hypothetical protein
VVQYNRSVTVHFRENKGMAKSAGEQEQKERDRIGEVRCLNCFHRHRVPPEAEKFVCPECGCEWRVSWVNPQLAKLRGPMWDKMGS